MHNMFDIIIYCFLLSIQLYTKKVGSIDIISEYLLLKIIHKKLDKNETLFYYLINFRL